MSIPKDITSKYKTLSQWSILVGYRGSIAHGMYLPNTDPNSIDDKDAMGVCVMPLDYYLGAGSHEMSRGVQEIKQDEWDVVAYELRKFVSLLVKGNPNVLSMLWLDENMYIKRTEAGQMLIDNRGLFVGRHVYHSLVGYAYGQMKRMFAFGGKIPEEYAYIAGIFDGEGHVSITRNLGVEGTHAPIHCLQIGITNTDRDLIERLLVDFGGNAGQTGIRGGHRMNAYRWRLSGPTAAKFLRLIHPYLTIKRRQAEIGMAFQHSVSSRKRGPLSLEDVAERDSYRDALAVSRREKTTPVPLAESLPSDLYKTAYMGDKRKRLVEKVGYDSKNASCLIRILRMGVEFLRDGNLQVMRADAGQLLEIKRGEWEMSRVKEEADSLFKEAELAFECSRLPHSLDEKKINGLLMRVMLAAMKERNIDICGDLEGGISKVAVG
jgi:hypothetical protein